MNGFITTGLSEELTAGLARGGIVEPAEIQAQAIPLVLAGRDVIGQAPTGTGKTEAYLAPLLQRVDAARREVQAIILAPTHELAMQIFRRLEKLAADSALAVTAAPLIGQVNIARQLDALKAKPQIIVGSAGRILELIQKRKINAQTVKTIVLDEADRLLDDANWKTVAAVVGTTLRDRQLLLFSATMPPPALTRAKELLREPELVAVRGGSEVPADIAHMYFLTEQRDKIELLRKLAHHLDIGRAIVFINNSDAIATMTAKLNYHGLAAAGIYGGAAKEERQKALADFGGGNVRFLVASDLAARGLDIPGIDYVINMDIPEEPQLYLHRAGRTGRAGRGGTAISLAAFREKDLLGKIARVLNISIKAKRLAGGRVYDVAARPAAAKRPAKKLKK